MTDLMNTKVMVILIGVIGVLMGSGLSIYGNRVLILVLNGD